MQNTPLLNTQQPAPQAMTNAKPGTPGSNQATHDQLFQQQLSQRIERQNQELRAHAKRQSDAAQQQKSAEHERAAASTSAERKTERTPDKRTTDDAEWQEVLATADSGKFIDAAPDATQSPPTAQSILAQLQQIQPAHHPSDVPDAAIDNLPADTGVASAAVPVDPVVNTAIVDPDTDVSSGPDIRTHPGSTNTTSAEHSKTPPADLRHTALPEESTSSSATRLPAAAPEQLAAHTNSDISSAKITGSSVASIQMQPGVTPAATPAPAPAATSTLVTVNQFSIQPHPGQEGWNQAIGERVMWMIGNTQHSATLMLNPPDMGPLQVVIHVHNDQADANFFSDRQEVRQALEDGMDNLRAMMKESGINLGQANINQHNQAPEFTSRQPQQPAQQAEAQTAGVISTTATPLRAALGLVDTFA